MDFIGESGGEKFPPPLPLPLSLSFPYLSRIQSQTARVTDLLSDKRQLEGQMGKESRDDFWAAQMHIYKYMLSVFMVFGEKPGTDRGR